MPYRRTFFNFVYNKLGIVAFHKFESHNIHVRNTAFLFLASAVHAVASPPDYIFTVKRDYCIIGQVFIFRIKHRIGSDNGYVDCICSARKVKRFDRNTEIAIVAEYDFFACYHNVIRLAVICSRNGTGKRTVLGYACNVVVKRNGCLIVFGNVYIVSFAKIFAEYYYPRKHQIHISAVRIEFKGKFSRLARFKLRGVDYKLYKLTSVRSFNVTVRAYFDPVGIQQIEIQSTLIPRPRINQNFGCAF